MLRLEFHVGLGYQIEKSRELDSIIMVFRIWELEISYGGGGIFFGRPCKTVSLDY